MFLGRSKTLKKVESCGLFWTGESEPFTLISKTLKGNGMLLSKIDRTHGRIVARFTPATGTGSCKVTLQLFPQEDVCLIVATLETLRSRDEGVMIDCVRRLKSCLDNVRLVDDEGTLDWKKRDARRAIPPGKAVDTIPFSSEFGTGGT